jgi:hypothetical protein
VPLEVTRHHGAIFARVQVVYEDRRWIAAILLVWSGNIIDAVDGVNPRHPPGCCAGRHHARRRSIPACHPGGEAGASRKGSDHSPDGSATAVHRFQVRYRQRCVWSAVEHPHWATTSPVTYLPVSVWTADRAGEGLALAVGSYSQILSVWQRLQRGDRVACEPVPPFVERILTDADVHKEPAFLPAVSALDSAITSINGAISAFDDACNNPSVVLTVVYIDVQLAQLDDAERSLILAGSLLEPLRRRNPLIDSSNG